MTTGRPGLLVAVIGRFQPTLYFVVDVFQRSDFNAMRDAIFFGKAASVDQAPFHFRVAERKSEVDARASRWLDLRKDVLAIQGHDRLTRTGFGLFANAETEIQQGIVNG